jgi:hypothetical protein
MMLCNGDVKMPGRMVRASDRVGNLGRGAFTATGTNDGLVARLDATGAHL